MMTERWHTGRTAAEIQAYCEAATEGPWVPEDSPYVCVLIRAPSILGSNIVAELGWRGNTDSDATFIANARIDLPLVLQDAMDLREALGRWLHGTLPIAEVCGEDIYDATAYLEEDDDGRA